MVVFLGCFGFWFSDSLKRVNIVKQSRSYLKSQRDVHTKLSEEDELILYGSNNYKRYRDFRLLYKKYPANKTYLANYLCLPPFFDNKGREFYEERTKFKKSYADLKETYLKLLGALNRAEKLEPDNAFYNYCKAQLYFNANYMMRDDKPSRKLKLISDYGRSFKQNPYFLPLDDDELLSRCDIYSAVIEYQRGLKKSYYRNPQELFRNDNFNELLTVNSWGNMPLAEKLGLVSTPKKELNCLFLINPLQYDFFDKMLEDFAVKIANDNIDAFSDRIQEEFENSRTLEELRVLLAENLTTCSATSDYCRILYMGDNNNSGSPFGSSSSVDEDSVEFLSLQSDAASEVEKFKDDDIDALIVKLLPKLKTLTESDYQSYIDETKFFKEINCNKSVQKWFGLLDKAQQLDPDNALYNYYKSSLLLRSAVIRDRYGDIPAFNKIYYKNGSFFILKDRSKLTLAFEEFEKGLTKKFYNAHEYELLQKQIDILKVNRRYDDLAYQNALCVLKSNFPFRSYSSQNNIRYMVIFHAKLLYYEGQIAEANRVLDTMPIYIKQLNKNARWIVDIYRNINFMKWYYETKINLWESEGDIKKVKYFKKQLFALSKLRSSVSISIPRGDIEKYGALWTSRQVWKSRTEFLKKANNERLLEFSFVFKVLSPVVLLVILIILFAKSQLMFLDEELNVKNITTVKLKIQDVFLVGVFGVVIPGSVYLYIVSKFEYLFKDRISEVVFQNFFLIISIVIPVSVILTIVTATRAKKANVKVPVLKYYYMRAIVLYSLFIFFAHLLIVSERGTGEKIIYGRYDLYILSGVILLYLLLKELIKAIKIFIGKKTFCEWRVIRRRKLLLWLFIASSLVLVCNSWVFSLRENYYINQDNCIFKDSKDRDIAVEVIKKKLNDDFLSNL